MSGQETSGRQVSRFQRRLAGAKTTWQRNWRYSGRRVGGGPAPAAIAARKTRRGRRSATRRPQRLGATESRPAFQVVETTSGRHAAAGAPWAKASATIVPNSA